MIQAHPLEEHVYTKYGRLYRNNAILPQKLKNYSSQEARDTSKVRHIFSFLLFHPSFDCVTFHNVLFDSKIQPAPYIQRHIYLNNYNPSAYRDQARHIFFTENFLRLNTDVSCERKHLKQAINAR